MTPTALEVTVMAVLVEEYRNGVLIGSVERDIQVTVITCSNQVPALTGINGTSNFTQNVCAGNQVCFTINSIDADAAQNTYVTWDASIPGATFNIAAGNRETATFCWTPTAADANSSPHCFTATVHDDNCPIWGSQTYSYCVVVSDLQVNVPGGNVGCNGTTTLTAAASGGSGAVTYAWSTGATTQSITAGAGNYTCTVSDGICTATANATVSQSASVTTSISSTNVLCNGGNNGSATVSTNGGTQPFTYSWSPSGGAAATANNLSAGNYTVTITDVLGCTSTSSVTITEPAQLAASASHTDVLCYGGTTGTASVLASNGTPGYTYSWSPSGGTGSTANGLSAGNYTVTVTDANGCTTTANSSVSEPQQLNASSSSTPALCNGSADGSASVVANNGTPGYTYSWSPSGGNASTANGLTAGNYTVTVTDNNGCTTVSTVTVNEPLPLNASIQATDALCNGGTDGTANVNVTDGTPGYNYSWSPSGGNTNQATGLSAGNYTVTVTDANGCTVTASAVVNEPAAMSASTTTNPVLCNGGIDGSASVNVSNGSPGYTYQWSPSGGASSQATGLAAGNYTVTVTDANGCTATASATVTEPTALGASATFTPVSCNGGTDGEASVVANDGTPGYSYSWSPSGGNSSIATGLAAGNYTVTVTDANGCSVNATTSVTEPTALTASASFTPVLCNGGADGIATVSAADGTPGYTYSWSSGGTNDVETSLAAGNYTVVVTDANGCTISTSVTVTEPALLTASATSTPALCNGSADGTASVNAADGTPGYSYAWSSGGNGATESGLASGVYVVTVTDANGCTTTANTFISEPPLLTASTSTSAVLCNGGNDGSATVSAQDGTPGYSYSWSSGGNAAIENNLSAGNYTVTVTDANGCTTTTTAVVTEPASLNVSTGSVACLCNGSSDGSATANPNGGTGNYQFVWNPGGSVSSSLNNVPAGNYTVVVTDANGCTTSATESITEPALLNVVLSSTPALCNGGNDGTASAIVSGGTAGYSYNWFPAGGTNAQASGLAAGNYTVTITDINGCVATDSVPVTDPPAITLSTNTNPAICGSATGTASVTAAGGSTPYNYSWSPAGGTASTAANISAGAYTVTVTDVNGCTADAIVNVLNTGGPAVNAQLVSAVSCNGGNDGSASVQVSSGTPPFSYVWSPAGGSAVNASGLAAGNYAVTVTDSNGCISSDNIIIPEPTQVAVQASATNTLCQGSSDGTASVIAAGGTAPYVYVWTPGGATTANALNLSAGNYSVTVTDSHGCTQTASATVQQPSAVVVAMSTAPAACFGTATGSATANPSGGSAGYTYVWTPGNSTSQQATGLASGNYSVTVTDAHGCTATNNVTVSEPFPVNASTSSTPATCGTSNGTATVNATGGTSPYAYLWSQGGTNAIASNLGAGTFTAVVTDANGCTATAQANVSNAGGPVAQGIVNQNVTCYGAADGSASVNVSSGNPPFNYIWSPAGGYGTQASGLAAGNYSVLISDSIGCITLVNMNISEPPPLTASATSTAATCGDANGAASVAANGGTGTLTYNWSPSGVTSALASSLTGGTYTVVVTDVNGCTASATTTVVNTGGASAILQATTNVTCFGGNDGAATVAVNGGALPYTFLWTPTGDTTASLQNIPAGNYIFTVTDSAGCVSAVPVIITAPDSIFIGMSTTPAGCNGAVDGSATAAVSGGVPPYNYTWSPVTGLDSVLRNIPAGNYAVQVVDQHGCMDSASITVISPTSVSLNISSQNITCYGYDDGSASVSVLTGTGPYTYNWLPAGGNMPVAENLSPGNYSVTVTDANGCEAIVNAVVTQPPALVATVSPGETLCIGQGTNIWVNASGGTQPYTFMWDNGNYTDSQFVSPSTTTSYSVEVADANGCSLNPPAILIPVHPPLNVVADATPEICLGDTAYIGAIAGGGNGGPYSYSWNNGSVMSSEAMVFPVADSTFTVIVDDGCSPPVQTDVHVRVHPTPDANFLPQLVAGCMPVNASFTNQATEIPGSLYSWDLGDGTQSYDAAVSHTYSTPGQYTVSLHIVTAEGCADEMTVPQAVNVFGLPDAAFDMSSHEVTILTPSIDFFDKSLDANGWTWDFGDQHSSYDTNPTHQYADTGTYSIRLIVQTEHGCLDTTYGMLRVVEDFTVFIPNAFTPNADLTNDGFMAAGMGWKDFEMFIIDRWGLQIFHSTSKDNPWNGTYSGNGNRCQSDVYEYIIRIHDKDGKLHKFLGHVTLVN